MYYLSEQLEDIMLKDILKKEKRINKIKEMICNLEDFRTGSLSEQYNVCGKAGCRCKNKENPEKHGPYYQISCYKNKKHTTRFVKKENVKEIKNEVETYKKFKTLVDEWILLNTEISDIKLGQKV
jgi:hypothetical protein